MTNNNEPIITIRFEDLLPPEKNSQTPNADAPLVITANDIENADKSYMVDAGYDGDGIENADKSYMVDAGYDGDGIDDVFAHFDGVGHEGKFGKEQVDDLKEMLNISTMNWGVVLTVDNSPSQAARIKARVVHMIAGKLIYALGLGMKQSQVPVFTFANHLAPLDPITENNASYYAGKSPNDEDDEDTTNMKTVGNKLKQLFEAGTGRTQDAKNKAQKAGGQSKGRTLENISPEGNFTYFHPVYSILRQTETPSAVIVVTDGRFSDDWDVVKMSLDWMEANDNPPMHFTFINVAESVDDYDPTQPPNMLARIQALNYSFINVIEGTDVIKMTPENIAAAVLQPLSEYALLLQRTPLLDKYGREKDQMVLGPNLEWNGTFEPWLGIHKHPTDWPDYNIDKIEFPNSKFKN